MNLTISCPIKIIWFWSRKFYWFISGKQSVKVMDYFAGLMTFQADDFKIGQKCPRDRKPLISGNMPNDFNYQNIRWNQSILTEKKNLNLDIYVHFSITDSTIKDAYKNTKVHKYAIFKIKKKFETFQFCHCQFEKFHSIQFCYSKDPSSV